MRHVLVGSLWAVGAGAYQLAHPEMSAILGMAKSTQVRATGLSLVASANPGCKMQLKTYLDVGTVVAHPIELYWDALRVR